jgi:hypothetical protein
MKPVRADADRNPTWAPSLDASRTHGFSNPFLPIAQLLLFLCAMCVSSTARSRMASGLGIPASIESKSLARFCCEFLNPKRLAKLANSKSVVPNEAQMRHGPQPRRAPRAIKAGETQRPA